MEEQHYYMTDDAKKKLKKDRRKHILLTVVCSLASLALGISVTSQVMKKQSSKLTSDDANLQKFMEIYELIKDEWYFGDQAEDESVYVDRALQAMVNGQDTDSYLRYYGIPETEVNVTYGLGVTVSAYDGYIIIDTVHSNSPAAKAGILEGDIITAVNNVSIRYLTMSAITSMVQGDYNTQVKLTILRNGVTKEITATRNVWTEDSVYSYDYGSYAVLKITGFDDNTATKADSYLAQLTASSRTTKVKNLVMDMRNNGGGYVMAFTQLADFFTPKGTKFGRYVFKNDAESYDVSAASAQKYTFDHIYILINGDSASATEAFTAAMQDNLSNVTVVGTTSYGKGIAQKTISFADGSSFKYTYAEYYRKTGAKVHKVGITPDIEIKEVGAQTVYDADYAEGETFEQHLTKYLNAMGYTGATYSDVLKAYQNAKGITASGTYDSATQGKVSKDLYDQHKAALVTQMDATIDLFN